MMHRSAMVAHMLLVFVSVVNAKTIHSVDQSYVTAGGRPLGCTYQEISNAVSLFFGCDSSNQAYALRYGSDPSCTGSDYSDEGAITTYYCNPDAKGDSYYSVTRFDVDGCNDNDISDYDEIVMQTCVVRLLYSTITYCMLNEFGLPETFTRMFSGDGHEDACRAEEYPTTLPAGGGTAIDECFGYNYSRLQLGGKDTYCHEPATAYCGFLAGYGVVEGDKTGDCKDACDEWQGNCIAALGDEYINYCDDMAKKNCKDKCKAYIEGSSLC